VRSPVPLAVLLGILLPACVEMPDGPSLSRQNATSLRLGDRIPDSTEAQAVGAIEARATRDATSFAKLVRCDDARIVFKDEEGTRADRMMTPRLRSRLSRLGELVQRRWPSLSLRVTEAWDEDGEHGPASLHYEGRAADVTTSDRDPAKLGELARLAVEAQLDWVFYESTTHVHVSVKR
jgi:hypothetical protein